ncbi:peptidase C39 family protein [soil metagenome]
MTSPTRRRSVCVIALAATLIFGLAGTAQAAPDRAAIKRWSSNASFAKGSADGIAMSGGALRIGTPAGTLSYADPYGSKKPKAYAFSTWTSPWVATSFATRRIVPSWNVELPGGTWVRIQMRGKTATKTSSWDTIANYGYATSTVYRRSASTQGDDYSSVATDTVTLDGSNTYKAWQLKVTLLRTPTSTATPVVTSLGAIASSYAKRTIATSKTTMTAAKDLDIPRYSQMIHAGQHDLWGGGGENWCSPTSVAMLLGYYRTGPKPADYDWSPYADSQVNHAARYTYDYRYKANGNWPFSTAYAGRYGLDAFVTRLYDLREAESFIKAGIPLAVSIKFAKGKLTGAPISATNGHLLVIRGFTKTGKVIVNDPAASSNASVRRTYSRAQFEKAWLGGSGGIAYVVRTPTTKLPTDSPRW